MNNYVKLLYRSSAIVLAAMAMGTSVAQADSSSNGQNTSSSKVSSSMTTPTAATDDSSSKTNDDTPATKENHKYATTVNFTNMLTSDNSVVATKTFYSNKEGSFDMDASDVLEPLGFISYNGVGFGYNNRFMASVVFGDYLNENSKSQPLSILVEPAMSKLTVMYATGTDMIGTGVFEIPVGANTGEPGSPTVTINYADKLPYGYTLVDPDAGIISPTLGSSTTAGASVEAKISDEDVDGTVDFKNGDDVIHTDAISGKFKSMVAYDATNKVPKGYRLAPGENAKRDINLIPKAKFAVVSTYKIVKDPTPVTPTNPDNQTPDKSDSSTTPTKPTTPAAGEPGSTEVKTIVDHQYRAVLAMGKATVNTGNLNGKAKLVTYKNGKDMQHKAMFVIQKTVKFQGQKYYYVRDANARFVNSNAKTNKTRGWIKAGSVKLAPAYNTLNKVSAKHPAKVRMINRKGVNIYRNVNLTGKRGHIKYGKTVKVIGQKKHNLTNRYKLSNGHWITSNQKLIVPVNK